VAPTDDDLADLGETVGTAADELYGLTPKEFVAARDAKVKELRAGGDTEAAREVAALRRPTVSAWLANQLVREHAAEIEPLLELGAGLREASATLSGSQLKELSKQRGQLVQALVRQARKDAYTAGQPVTEDAARGLEQTLHAALADEHAGELLREGRLAEVLRHDAFSADPGGPVTRRKPAPRRTSKSAPSPEERERAERRAALEVELADAWKAARAAADARADAEDAAIVAERAATEARRTAQRLAAELEQAETAHEAAAAESAEAAAARDEARGVAERATKRVSELQRALDDA
jgi:hypothetical protein